MKAKVLFESFSSNIAIALIWRVLFLASLGSGVSASFTIG